MATATPPKHAVPQAQPNAGQVEARTPRSAWVSIDSGFATVGAVSALAIAAFSFLTIRIDNVATELRGEIKQVGTEVKRYTERTDDKIDKLTEKMDRMNDKLNAPILSPSRAI